MRKHTLILFTFFLSLSALAAMQPESQQPKNPQDNNGILVFAHGLGGNKYQVEGYENHFFQYIDPCNSFAENIHGAPSEISLGQHHEIGFLKRTILYILDYKRKVNSPIKKVDIQGVSMGAATAINLVGTHPELAEINLEGTNPGAPIRSLILESPFASMKDVLENIVKNNFFLRILDFFIPSLKYRILKQKFPNHDIDGIQPIDVIKNIRIPMLIFGSKKDHLTPYEGFRKLYKAARESGNNTCHYFEVEHGQHANTCWENTDNINIKILGIVHAFREHYQLANCSKVWAKAGRKDFLEKTQPTFNEL